MKLKKIFSILLALCLISALFSACTSSERPALSIAGAEITQGVYAYYLDKAMATPSDYGLDLSAGAADYKNKAIELCKEYVAVNTTFKELGLSLTVAEKTDLSTKVSGFWRIYSKYYTSTGVSKQTLTKIESSNSEKDKLFLYYYDTGGTKAVPESTIKAYFNANYFVFQAINGYLTKTDEDGNTVDLNAAEIKSLQTEFNAMAKSIAKGETIQEAGISYAAEQDNSSVNTDVTVIGKDNTAYPAGFYEAVAKLKAGTPKVIMLGKYIFLVVKVDISKSEQDFYQQYRTDSLKALKGGEMDTFIASVASGYSVAKQDKIMDKIYKTISTVK